MPASIEEQKEVLRQRMRARRAALSVDLRHRYSLQAISRLRAWWHAHAPENADLLCYRSFAEELITDALFANPPAQRIYAPSIDRHGEMHWRLAQQAQWRKGRYGIMQPDGAPWDASRPAVVVCPLVAFDHQGGRLGMGKGYFDRWLAHPHPVLLIPIGLAFALQEVDRVPMQAHDVHLSWIITEKETIRCR